MQCLLQVSRHICDSTRRTHVCRQPANLESLPGARGSWSGNISCFQPVERVVRQAVPSQNISDGEPAQFLIAGCHWMRRRQARTRHAICRTAPSPDFPRRDARNEIHDGVRASIAPLAGHASPSYGIACRNAEPVSCHVSISPKTIRSVPLREDCTEGQNDMHL